jgi:copper chaperone
MTTTVTIKGMSCQHCVMAVTNALKEIQGVQDVSVDLGKGAATFTHERAIDTNRLKTVIENAGYDMEA